MQKERSHGEVLDAFIAGKREIDRRKTAGFRWGNTRSAIQAQDIER